MSRLDQCGVSSPGATFAATRRGAHCALAGARAAEFAHRMRRRMTAQKPVDRVQRGAPAPATPALTQSTKPRGNGSVVGS